MSSPLPVLIFLVPFVAALAIGAVGWRARWLRRGLLLGALGATAALATAALARTTAAEPLIHSMGNWAVPLGIEWRIDLPGAVLVALVAWISLVVLGGSGGVVAAELKGREAFFYACALLLESGLLGMASTADLFNFFVHLEVASLSAYALVGAGGRGAPLAALRYLVIGSLGASFYLLGVGHVYAATGTLSMADAAARIAAGADPTLSSLGAAFIALGLAVKMALFPLHAWMPNAYTRSPLAAAAFMAPLVTKVSAFAVIRILYGVYGVGFLRHGVIGILLCAAGTAAVLIGGLAAAAETDLRRLLAFSSVSQIGLVAIGIGLVNRAALTGAVLHITNDALMKAALFLAASVLGARFGARQVRDLARLRGRAPWTTAVVVIAGLSVVGVPPLCGFFGKWYVLQGAIEAGHPALAAVIVAGSLLSVVYVFRLLEPLCFAAASGRAAAPARERAGEREGPAVLVAACGVLAAAVILFGIFNERVVAHFIEPWLPGGL